MLHIAADLRQAQLVHQEWQRRRSRDRAAPEGRHRFPGKYGRMPVEDQEEVLGISGNGGRLCAADGGRAEFSQDTLNVESDLPCQLILHES